MDKNKLEKFIKLASKKLSGDWVIVGGSVLPLLGASTRYTEDIDIVGPKDSTQQDTLILMRIAKSLQLPIEAINQAAAFFLHQVPRWKQELKLLYSGGNAKIYRPTSTLYLLLKIKRMTENDLNDCIKMIAYSKEKNEPLNKKKVIHAITFSLKRENNTLKKKRLSALLMHLS